MERIDAANLNQSEQSYAGAVELFEMRCRSLNLPPETLLRHERVVLSNPVALIENPLCYNPLMESDSDPKPANQAKLRSDSSSFVGLQPHVPLPPPARRPTPFLSIALCVLGIAVVLGGASALRRAHKSAPLETASASSVKIDDGVFRQKFGWFRPAGPGSIVGNGATVIIDGRNTGLHPFPSGDYGMFELEVPAGAADQPHTAVVLVTQRYGDLMVPYTYRNTFKHTRGIREWQHVSTELSRDGGPFEMQ